MVATDTRTYTLAERFEDPEDGDSLTYSAASNGPNVDLDVSDGVLRLAGAVYLRGGAVAVPGADIGGKTASRSFRVLAKP